MIKPLKLRLAAVILLALAPPAALLGVLSASAAVAWEWAVVVLAVGAVLAAWIALTIEKLWRQKAQRIDAVAGALERRRTPAHFQISRSDEMGPAEHHLAEATDQLIAEVRALAEQADELDAILRGMSEAVVVTNAYGKVVLLNGAARRMFALSPDSDYRGRDFVELCRDPRLQEFVASSMLSADGRVISAELFIQNPTARHLGVNVAPVRPARRAAAAWVLVFHDITQLKSYETARSDFIANLTHELRTPLSALCGYAETLIQGVDDAETAKRFLGIIERQSRRLARLIDDLISLSDLERGFTPLKFESLAPERVIHEAVELMRAQAERGGVTLETRGGEGLPAILADRDRIHQVMLNLIDNAIKYTPRSGSVNVEARENSSAEPGVELIVSDSGEGIPAADIPRLTERFYRVDRARSRELGGTGLGLAIVKHIVQLHHGRLKIESRIREGATVTVWIPAAATEARPAAD